MCVTSAKNIGLTLSLRETLVTALHEFKEEDCLTSSELSKALDFSNLHLTKTFPSIRLRESLCKSHNSKCIKPSAIAQKLCQAHKTVTVPGFREQRHKEVRGTADD